MIQIGDKYHAALSRAEERYSDALAYHNWVHAEDVMRIVADIADKSIDPHIRADRDLLVTAAAWHDADYHVEDLGRFETKESRSADLAMRLLTELTESDRRRIADGIIDTTVELHPKSSLFGEVLHAADIGYFADSADRFLERLTLMREEWGSPDWATTVDRTVSFGVTVIEETLPLMERILPRKDAVAWIGNIERNLSWLQAELADGHLRN